ncbi:hypothetical protein AN189_18075 [Loktanella sp. 3ANDIMAR09]|uniref:hypothetical protein n=1 Tax=Loktanella sp. 3ANDIMAR09 TaxID=1225657 RepID=UPI0006F3578E|nr:hypothetical protein [Loktanella sp. 3ANDIMAR09]KQI66963.1 hypothetical protein AN189_18075 [Loktanella sp. 3ANDIMAR09]
MVPVGARDPLVAAETLILERHWPGEDVATVEGCLAAATAIVETACARPARAGTFDLFVETGGWSRWWVPIAPVRQVVSVAIGAGDGTYSDLSLSGLRLHLGMTEPQVIMPSLADLAHGCELRVRVEAGHDDGAWPVQIVQAIKLIAAEFYEDGIAGEAIDFSDLTFAAGNLIRQVRYQRPHVFGCG